MLGKTHLQDPLSRVVFIQHHPTIEIFLTDKYRDMNDMRSPTATEWFNRGFFSVLKDASFAHHGVTGARSLRVTRQVNQSVCILEREQEASATELPMELWRSGKSPCY